MEELYYAISVIAHTGKDSKLVSLVHIVDICVVKIIMFVYIFVRFVLLSQLTTQQFPKC